MDMQLGESFQAIVLAAGRGSRMGSDLPKVLLPLCGRPMISYILDALKELGIPRPVAVIGKNGDAVVQALGDQVVYARQEEQLGSGHAVACARETALDAKNVLIMCGDSPLFRIETIRSLMETHIAEKATVTLMSSILSDPTGYGRIVRSESGEISGVVEEKMASPEEKAIREINGGCYAFDGQWLWSNIDRMQKNEAGEYCLTEMVDVAVLQGRKVSAVPADPEELIGANTPDQLRGLEEILISRSGDCVKSW